jgi:molybdopterin converting factor small subunit
MMGTILETENTIIVEFTGMAKNIAGEATIQLTFPPEATFHDVVQKLAALYPDMVNILIDPNERIFLSSNLFVINDEMTSPVFIMEEHPKDGDKLTLLSVMTGG